MLVKGTDLPEALLRAKEAGELVVFVGAGVSYPPPSNLPLFTELALKIGENSGVAKNDSEPEDRYLGRLKQKGVSVHEKSARILVNDATKPHELHRQLLQLFPSLEKIRIVTTNFDTHFSTACKEIFGDVPDIFYAPALPLGNDFSGIAYLHGCAGKQSKNCVLTDEDFGRAYLTQAWASRFLAAMFSQYAVLFVGYSHGDVVMNYLARGLPPALKPRFAFTTADRNSTWEYLGIKPLVYEKCEGENQHHAITECVTEWVKESHRGLLEKAERIRILAESKPPLEGAEADYLKYCLSNIDTARIFLKYAKSPEWISWLEKHQFVQSLFKSGNEPQQFERELALWLVETFLVKHSQQLMLLIERFHCKINANLCWCIWRRLFIRDKDAANAISSTVFSQWVAILLEQSHDVLAHENLANLLTVCRFPEEKPISVLLFERVTKPRLVLKEAFHFFVEDETDGGKVDFDIQFGHARHEEYSLREAWQKHFLPNLTSYANDLEPVVISNLTAANTLRTLGYPKNPNVDIFGLHRQSIHPNSQDQFPNSIDILIDAARDILNHWIEQRPQFAAGRIETWFATDVPILRRLSIYGFGKRTDISPDEKLNWIERHKLLYSFKTDIYWLLEQSYAKASESARQKIIENALLGGDWPEYENIEEKTKQYEVFNTVVWLHRIAPNCPITNKALSALKDKNPDFGEREFPQFSIWSGGVQSVDPTGGLNVDDILQKSPEEVLDELLRWQPKSPSPSERNRSSYCNVVSAAVAKKPDLGLKWLQVLVSRKLMDADLWYCVCQGWRNASLSPEMWEVILDAVQEIVAPPEFFSAFAEVLENGSRKESFTLPGGLMEKAEKIAIRIWDLVLKVSSSDKKSSDDWLGIAINRPGGKLAEFWLQRISVARKAAADDWSGLPQQLKSHLTEVLHGTSDAAAHYRIVFASQLHYFFSLDREFAMAELLPLFDWRADSLRAEQSWHGFLCWGRWLGGYAEQLLPFFTETIARNTQFGDRVHDYIIYQIAAVALFQIDNPLKNGWLPKAIQSLSDKDLTQLAATIDRYLSEVQSPVSEKIWETWLADYWQMRLSNTPKPIVQGEANEMACWAFGLGRYFPAAVKLAVSMKQILTMENTNIPYRLDDRKEMVKNHPDAVADLVLLYLQAPLPYFFFDEHFKSIWEALRHSGIAREKLNKIREELFRRGTDVGEP